MTLIDKFSFKFAHMACSDSHERNGGRLVIGDLLDTAFLVGLLFDY
jgi:hypothetical protein